MDRAKRLATLRSPEIGSAKLSNAWPRLGSANPSLVCCPSLANLGQSQVGWPKANLQWRLVGGDVHVKNGVRLITVCADGKLWNAVVKQ